MIDVSRLDSGDVFYICNSYYYICKCKFISFKNGSMKYKDITEDSLTNGMIRDLREQYLQNCFLNKQDALTFQQDCKRKVMEMSGETLLKRFYAQLSNYDLLTEEERDLYGKAIKNITAIDVNEKDMEIRKAKSEANFAIIALGEAKAELEALRIKYINNFDAPGAREPNDLLEKIEDKDRKLHLSYNSANELKSELEDREKKLKASYEKISGLKNQLESKTSELVNVKNSINELKIELTSAKKELEKAKLKPVVPQNKIDELNDRIFSLQKELKQKEQVEKLLEDTKKMAQALQLDNQKLNTKVKELLDQLKNKQYAAHLNGIEEDAGVLKAQLNENKRSLDAANSKNSKLISDNNNLRKQIKDLEAVNKAAGDQKALDKMDVLRLVGAMQTMYDDEDKMLIYVVYNGRMAITNLFLDPDGEDLKDPASFYGKELVDEFYQKYENLRGDRSDIETISDIVKKLLN